MKKLLILIVLLSAIFVAEKHCETKNKYYIENK